MLLTTPLILLISRNLPTAQIDVWCPAFTSLLVQGFPGVSNVWIIEKLSGFGLKNVLKIWRMLLQTLRLRRIKYDWVIAANGEYSKRAVDKAGWVAGRKLVFFRPSVSLAEAWGQGFFPLESPSVDIHESVRLAQLASPILGRQILEQECPLPQLSCSADQEILAMRFLERWGLTQREYIVIGLGARKAKRQPTVDQVLSWTQWLSGRNLRVVLSYTPGGAADPGYPSDAEMAQKICEADPTIAPLAGDIQEAISVINLAKFSVIPDSGLMHIAAATKGGVIGLYADPESSPNPSQWGPRGHRCQEVVAERSVSEVPDIQMFQLFEGYLK